VTKFDAKLRHEIQRMVVTLSSQKWGAKLGIAAPQVGINKRVIISLGRVMINPEWQPSKAPPETITEGCYSVGKKTFRVSRAKYGWAKWQTINGEWREEKIKGLPAVVFQHELDHLDGKCCIDTGEPTGQSIP
jgi:peptide deformylase